MEEELSIAKNNSLQIITKKDKIIQNDQNELSLIKTEYYKNPDMNSISSSTLQLEENIKKSDSNSVNHYTLEAILEEMNKITFSLPSAYNDKLTLDNLNYLTDLFRNEVDDKFYEVFVIF